MAIVIDGKKVMKTKGNIKIIPSEAPVFRDKKEIYVFPHSVSRKKRNEVFRIMTGTDSRIERIAKTISDLFNLPEGLEGFNMSQSYADSLPLPFIPEYNFIRYETKTNGAKKYG
jgi:hypothetical protein